MSKIDSEKEFINSIMMQTIGITNYPTTPYGENDGNYKIESLKLGDNLMDLWRNTIGTYQKHAEKLKKDLKDLIDFYKDIKNIDPDRIKDRELYYITIGDYKTNLTELSTKNSFLDLDILLSTLKKDDLRYSDISPLIEDIDSRITKKVISILKPKARYNDANNYISMGKILDKTKFHYDDSALEVYKRILIAPFGKKKEIDISEIKDIPELGKLFENINILPEYDKYYRYLKRNKEELMSIKREQKRFNSSKELITFIRNDIAECIKILAVLYSVSKFSHFKYKRLTNDMSIYSFVSRDTLDTVDVMKRILKTINDIDKMERQIYYFLMEMNMKMVKEKMKTYSRIIR